MNEQSIPKFDLNEQERKLRTSARRGGCQSTAILTAILRNMVNYTAHSRLTNPRGHK